jgi:ribosomal protein L11 methylase PrmA
LYGVRTPGAFHPSCQWCTPHEDPLTPLLFVGTCAYVLYSAVKKYGARGVGVDIDPDRITEANQNARKAGVAQQVEFRQGDLFKADIGEATVVTLYLLPTVNERLKPKLLSELKPGTRIVSHAFDMGDWKPVREMEVDGRLLYLWVVPEHSGSGAGR